MCGIAGYVALEPGRRLDPGPLDAMLGRLVHRGPDDEGRYIGNDAILGHRRLSIIDLAGGRQPLKGARDTTWIVANGEIYNFRELGRELTARGHRFRTRSDTEVAAHAYDAWGLDFVDWLDGMFALAIWDEAHRRFVLARDRFGEKPLYYTVADDLLVFASELSALMAHPSVEARLDERSLSAYLALEYVPAPYTILRGISKLEPATALVVEKGEVRTYRYWQPDPRPSEPPMPYWEAVEQLRSLLNEAVRSRMVSDVPLGVFLSGGVDSSLIAALAARHGPIETFSIGFSERSFDESGFARTVADYIGSRHHERTLEASAMPDLVPRIADLLDEPLGDASIVPTALLSAFARERITVALGGDGGDELFAGYPMHQAHRVSVIARAVPRIGHRALARAACLLPVSHRNFSLAFKVQTFLRGSAEPPPWNHVLWMSSFSLDEQRRLLMPEVFEAAGRGEALFTAVHERWKESEGAPPIARATHLDAGLYLPNDILMKVDRASMAVALEVRSPFLSRAVAEFAHRLPDRYRMDGLRGKRILRDAAHDLIPRSILERPKKGFGIPVAAWLNGSLRPLVRDLLSAESLRDGGLFQPQTVERLLQEHEQRVADHRKPLWTLLMFELWRRHHLASRRIPVSSAGLEAHR